MCGITGLLHADAEKPAEAELLRRMCGTLVQCGPDGDGSTRERPDFQVKFVALGRDGATGCAAIWGTKEGPPEAALQTSQGFRVVQGQYLYEGAPAGG